MRPGTPGLLLFLIAGCSQGTPPGVLPPPPPPPPPPAPVLSMTVFEGQGQAGQVGSTLPVNPAVRITNQDNQAVAGVAVAFMANANGTVTGANALTDATGVARVGGWTLGPVAGTQTLSVTAAAQGSPLAITAVANPGPAVAVLKAEGDDQVGTVGQAVPVVPALRVLDEFGNPVNGVDVVFVVTGGQGTVTEGNQMTGADGLARPGAWLLGVMAGPNLLSATAGLTGLAGNPATFTATGNPGPVASLVKVAGDNQSAGISQPVPVAPTVDLVDFFGNLIPGADVLFEVTGGGGTVTGAQAVSAPDGRATAGSWTLGPVPGPNTLSATAGEVTVTFDATGLTPVNASQFAGTYTGIWTNTTFGSTGTVSATVTVDEGAGTVSATIAVTGPVLGSAGVAPTNQQTAFTDAGATFMGTLPVMGDVVATIDAGGNITASGTSVPNPGISSWDATGTLTATALNLSFTVTFTAGAPAAGTIALTKP